MGQSNVWYADKPQNEIVKQTVFNFINENKIPIKHTLSSVLKGKGRQSDPYLRQKIEKIAIKLVKGHYESLGYVVDSVEKDNVGWDLVATMNNKVIKLEVKGLSQKNILIELTPNEYSKMKIYKDNYRICAVTVALCSSPVLTTFSFSPENGKWEDDNGNLLKIKEVVSARMST